MNLFCLENINETYSHCIVEVLTEYSIFKFTNCLKMGKLII